MVSCLGPHKDDSIIFICANWLTVEYCETVLGHVSEHCIMVFDHMLKAEDCLSPLCLMHIFQKLKLSLFQFCLSVILLRALPDLDWVSLQ